MNRNQEVPLWGTALSSLTAGKDKKLWIDSNKARERSERAQNNQQSLGEAREKGQPPCWEHYEQTVEIGDNTSILIKFRRVANKTINWVLLWATQTSSQTHTGVGFVERKTKRVEHT